MKRADRQTNRHKHTQGERDIDERVNIIRLEDVNVTGCRVALGSWPQNEVGRVEERVGERTI